MKQIENVEDWHKLFLVCMEEKSSSNNKKNGIISTSTLSAFPLFKKQKVLHDLK